jgi:hypothetical protein
LELLISLTHNSISHVKGKEDYLIYGICDNMLFYILFISTFL